VVMSVPGLSIIGTAVPIRSPPMHRVRRVPGKAVQQLQEADQWAVPHVRRDTKPKPFVIITLGPTGAGKTGLVNRTISHCELNPNPTPRVFLVDDLVVNNQKYKDAVSGIIKTNNMTLDTVENDMTKPEVIAAFNAAYWGVRRSNGCVNNGSENCDDVTDSQMKAAIKNNESFVLEITGSSIPKWFLDNGWLGDDPNLYDVFVSCVLVSSLDTLIERNKSRFKHAFELFMNNQDNPAPRLPNITEETFDDSILTIKKTVHDMYSQCVLTKNESKCGKEKIDRLLVFSNNKDMTLEFDSIKDTSEVFEGVINRLYPSNQTVNNQTGNARRRRTQKIRRFHKRINTKKMRKSIKNKRIRKHPKI